MDGMHGRDDFLSDAVMEQANDILQLNDDAIEACKRAARIVRDHPALEESAMYYRDRIITADGQDFQSLQAELKGKLVADHSEFVHKMGEQSGMFAALIILLALPKMIAYYHRHHIPLTILKDTISDLPIW